MVSRQRRGKVRHGGGGWEEPEPALRHLRDREIGESAAWRQTLQCRDFNYRAVFQLLFVSSMFDLYCKALFGQPLTFPPGERLSSHRPRASANLAAYIRGTVQLLTFMFLWATLYFILSIYSAYTSIV